VDLAGHAHHALLREGVLRLAQKLNIALSTNKNAPKYYYSFEKKTQFTPSGEGTPPSLVPTTRDFQLVDSIYCPPNFLGHIAVLSRCSQLLQTVGLSVCRSVTIVSSAKAAEPIKMLFGVWIRTCRGQRLHPFNRLPNFYHNYLY